MIFARVWDSLHLKRQQGDLEAEIAPGLTALSIASLRKAADIMTSRNPFVVNQQLSSLLFASESNPKCDIQTPYTFQSHLSLTMSTQQPPDLGTTGTPPPPPKPQRILACIDCQQRKIKCDRKTPCQNCIKSRTQCVPATQMKRERKRRFPERELLERLRKYEDLLRRNGVGFEPLHKEKEPKDRDWDDRQANTVREWSSPAETLNSEKTARNQEVCIIQWARVVHR